VNDPSGDCDLAIVGAGIVGLATAHELQRRDPGARIVVLEREDRVGVHQTGSNSGVAHAGIYYKPGSLKARLCVEGIRRLYDFCHEHDVAHERCGKVIVALDRSELGRLDELEHRGRANGVPGLRRIGPDEIRELEPHATGIDGLHSPQTGIVDFAAVARALARGVDVVTGCAVERFVEERGGVRVVHEHGETHARRAIACAGLWSDRLAVRSGQTEDPRIVPFRGGYHVLRRRELVRGLIYPVPDPALPFLGIHLTKRIDGEVLVGPTALLVGARDAYALRTVRRRDLVDTLAWPGTRRVVRRWWRSGATELATAASTRAFAAAARRYVPELDRRDLAPGPAGVRAQAVGRDGSLVDDFVFSRTEHTLHVRNAPSPGATSSLAIAEHVVNMLAGP
jgi:(S)-2-hydroxyglutarate dehydrogenase